MSGFNQATLVGRLGRDPETRHTQGGDKIVGFSLATDEVWKDRSTGERKSRTAWHQIVIFNPGLGGVAEQFLRKGSQVLIVGQIQYRTWTDKSGQERTSTEIVVPRFGGSLVLLGSKPEGGRDTRRAEAESLPDVETYDLEIRRPSRSQALNDLDDEIPF